MKRQSKHSSVEFVFFSLLFSFVVLYLVVGISCALFSVIQISQSGKYFTTENKCQIHPSIQNHVQSNTAWLSPSSDFRSRFAIITMQMIFWAIFFCSFRLSFMSSLLLQRDDESSEHNKKERTKRWFCSYSKWSLITVIFIWLSIVFFFRITYFCDKKYNKKKKIWLNMMKENEVNCSWECYRFLLIINIWCFFSSFCVYIFIFCLRKKKRN